MRNNGNTSNTECILRDASLNGTARCKKYHYNPITSPLIKHGSISFRISLIIGE